MATALAEVKLERVFRSHNQALNPDPSLDYPQAEVTAVEITKFLAPCHRDPASGAPRAGECDVPAGAELFWLLTREGDQYNLYMRDFPPPEPVKELGEDSKPYLDLLRYESAGAGQAGPLIWQITDILDAKGHDFKELVGSAVLAVYAHQVGTPGSPPTEYSLQTFTSNRSEGSYCQIYCTPRPHTAKAQNTCDWFGCP